MARVETHAYSLLAGMGASEVARVVTAGGGAQNPVWTALREQQLSAAFNRRVAVSAAANGEASYGAALLARNGMRAALAEEGWRM